MNQSVWNTQDQVERSQRFGVTAEQAHSTPRKKHRWCGHSYNKEFKIENKKLKPKLPNNSCSPKPQQFQDSYKENKDMAIATDANIKY